MLSQTSTVNFINFFNSNLLYRLRDARTKKWFPLGFLYGYYRRVTLSLKKKATLK